MLLRSDQKNGRYVFLLFVTLYRSGIHGHPCYEYNCEDTFYPDDSSIFVTDESPTSCFWMFETHADETFLLTFQDFGIDWNNADCSKQNVEVRDRSINVRHCGDHKTPYTVTTLSNKVTITSWKSKQTAYFSFEAFLTRNIKSQLTVYETPMIWTEASAMCKLDGGYLAESYPVVSAQLKLLIHKTVPAGLHIGSAIGPDMPNRNKPGYWIGKSLTPWVMMHGCVRLEKNTGSVQAYRQSKYNQMSECASACSGSVYFLLQKSSCYCIKDTEKMTLTFIPYKKCNSPCPGMSREMCGGWNVFTLYEYYDGDIIPADNGYCVYQKGKPYQHKQSSCDTEMGFSCNMKNGSVVIYNRNVPGRRKVLSWHKALAFCSSLSGSLGMSPAPKYHQPYFSESYWTTITRTVDWNYDTATQRQPEFSSVATLDRLGDYIEYIRNSSEKHGFVCQKDGIQCKHKEVSDSGNITYPEFTLSYIERKVCEWHITVNESKVINLLIEDMDVEDSPGCIYDYLLVRHSNTKMEKLCGQISKKYIFTKNNTVTLVFRIDNTVTGKGFTVLWSAVDPASDKGSSSSKKRSSLKGGAVVGITVAVSTICVVLVSLCACVVYKKRHSRQDVQDAGETSTAHNAIYAISSFNNSSFTDEDDRSYQNESQTRRKYNLKAEASYANDPSKQNECSANVYQTIPYNNHDTVPAGNLGGLESVDSKSHGERTKGHSTDVADVAIDGATGTGQPCAFDISNIDDLGKDCIKVESVENIGHADMKDDTVIYKKNNEASVIYTDVVLEKTTSTSDMTEEGEYLNEGLDSNALMPHYEDIPEPSDDTQRYIRMDETPGNNETENRTSNIYLEV